MNWCEIRTSCLSIKTYKWEEKKLKMSSHPTPSIIHLNNLLFILYLRWGMDLNQPYTRKSRLRLIVCHGHGLTTMFTFTAIRSVTVIYVKHLILILITSKNIHFIQTKSSRIYYPFMKISHE